MSHSPAATACCLQVRALLAAPEAQLLAGFDTHNGEGLAPLHLAARATHVPLCAELLAAGAPANTTTRKTGDYNDGNWVRKASDGTTV